MNDPRKSSSTTAPWLEILPDSWWTAKMGRVVRFCNGADCQTVESSTGEYPVYGSGGEFRRATRYLYDGESVLFGRKGTIDRPLHVVGKFWTVDTMYYTIPGGRVLPRFLYFFATTIPFDYYATNTALPSMTQRDLAGHPMPLPPLGVQKQIADFLDRETAQIDTLIAKQEQLIARLKERRAAVIEDLIDSYQRSTSGARLKHIIVNVAQGWSPQCHSWPADGVQKWAVLRAGAANHGIFRAGDNKELPDHEEPRPEIVVRRGQLVISRANTRELLGSAAVVEGDYPRLMLSDKLYAFTLDERVADPRFVACVLGTRRWRDLIELEAVGASPSMQNIAQTDIVNLPMDLPTLAVQRQVVAELDAKIAKIDALVSKAQEFIALSKERRSALITAAVTGQIDVTTGKRREGAAAG